MKSSLRPAPMRLSIPACLLLLCGACASGPPIVNILDAMPCVPLIGESLRADVPPVDLPAGDTAGEWIAALDGQTGRLDQANANRRAVVEIAEACDRQRAAVAERLRPRPWWRLW